MNWFFYTSAFGWLASIFFAGESLLPYLLRKSAISRWLGTTDAAKPYLARMWAHYWIGYALLPLAFFHAWIPMAAGVARGKDMMGLWLGSGSLLLLLVQLILGLSLKRTNLSARRQIRQIHFWIMMAIAVTLVAHIWLNA